MKRSELVLTALLIPLDLVMITLAFLAAYQLRLNVGEVNFVWPFSQYLGFVALLAPVWIAIFAFAGLYSIRESGRPWKEFANLFVGVSGGTFLVIAWPFLTRQEFFSRLIVIYLFLFALLFVGAGRWAIRRLQAILYRYGIGIHHIAIVGTNGVAASLAAEINASPSLGIKIIGIIKESDHVTVHPDLASLPVLGTVNEFVDIAKKQLIDELLVATHSLSRTTIVELLEECHFRRIDFKLSPSLLEVHTANIDVEQIAGIPILEYKRTPLDGWGRILKRVVDITGSLIGIVLFSPFLLATALAVKFTSKGPVIYKNERVGDEGNFFAYKFRSMRIEYCTGEKYSGEAALQYEQELIEKQNTRRGPLYKVGHDPRLTPIGNFIRKTSLDELPQFFNVLRGEMSLVGPRPHQPREVDKYERHHFQLFHIKPGLTGLGQVSGRSDLEFEDEYRLDKFYIENWSPWLDVQIIIRTPFAILASRQRKAA